MSTGTIETTVTAKISQIRQKTATKTMKAATKIPKRPKAATASTKQPQQEQW